MAVGDIKILGKLVPKASDGILAGADGIYDDNLQLFQDEINQRAVNIISAGYVYAGIATPDMEVETPVSKCFYLATDHGTYTHFGNIFVDWNEAVFIKWDGDKWVKELTGLASVDSIDRVFDAGHSDTKYGGARTIDCGDSLGHK